MVNHLLRLMAVALFALDLGLWYGALSATSDIIAQEKVELSTPVSRPSITAYEPIRLVLDWHAPLVDITLRATVADCQVDPDAVVPPGCLKKHQYTGETARTLMTGLNRANLTTVSLRQRILQRLVDDKVIAGTVQ